MDNTNQNTPLPDEADKFLNDKFGKVNVFTAPDNYFEGLSVKVSDEIHRKKEVFQPLFKPRFIYYTAALAIVMIVASYYFGSFNLNKTQPVLSYDDVLNTEMISGIDENLLVEELSLIEETFIDEDQKLLDYLIENNTDITLITNEL